MSILVSRMDLRGRRVRKQASNIVSRNNLYQITAVHMSDLDECWFKCQNKGIM